MISHHKHKVIAPMEGLRAFAAFLVFLCHYAAQSQAWIPADSITSALILNIRFVGASGVDLFFILSGYLIYGMLIKKSVSLNTYIYRRVNRIYPTFLVMMVVYIALSLLVPSENKIPSELGAGGLFIVQSLLLLPGVFDLKPLITVAWTLSYEMFFYILIPFIILVFNLREKSQKQRMFFLICWAVLGFSVGFFWSHHVEMLLFISGMILFEIRLKGDKLSWRYAHLIFPITFILMMIVRHSFDFYFDWLLAVIMFFGYGLACFSAFDDNSKMGVLFSKLPLRWLGNMSYSYYLIHGLTLKFLFMVLAFMFPPEGNAAWVFYICLVPFFICTLFASVFLFYFIEKPFSLTNKVATKKEVHAKEVVAASRN